MNLQIRLRCLINSENTAINEYLSLIDECNDPLIKQILRNIAEEEVTHTGELTKALAILDKQTFIDFKKGFQEQPDVIKWEL